MKKLQEQIDALNAANKPVQSNTGKIMSLFALTSLIAYAHKLPAPFMLLQTRSVHLAQRSLHLNCILYIWWNRMLLWDFILLSG